MTDAHTPGPWAVQDPMGPEILSIVAGENLPVYQWKHIAQINVQPDDETDAASTEAEANANLIAAAPDLLAACMVAKKYVEALEKHLDQTIDGSAPTIREHASMIRAAIAKARLNSFTKG